jgi:HlyD family secretion protein
MNPLRKHPGLIFGSLIILVLTGIGFVPRPVLVDIVTVKRSPLRVTIEEEGKTRVIDHYLLSAPVDGYLRRINLHVGDPVSRGQTIGSLEPLRPAVLDTRARAEAEARIAAATAALKAAEQEVSAADADAGYAADELGRIRQLHESGAVSLDKLQQAEADARRTLARLESARFAVQIAQYEKIAAEASLKYSVVATADEQSETVTLSSPVDGSVLKIHHQSEGVVYKGEPLVDLGDPHSLEIVVEVLSRDAVRITEGMRVLLTRWGGDGTLQGSVRTIEPTGFTKISALGVEEQRVQVIVDIDSAPQLWERLGDGYRVETAFILWEEPEVLQIPTSAMFRQGDGWAVYVVTNKRAETRNVEPGQRGGIYTQILSGLDVGVQIINHPGDNLEAGSRVRSR